jgi:DNA-binding transcriptional regulator YbjK
VARKRDQDARRQQLIDAARDAVAAKGVASVQLRDVAKAAELTPGAILYYYEDLHDLLQQVYEGATRRYSVEREQAISALSSSAARLGTALRMSVPTGPDDVELRMLFEFDAMLFVNPRYIDFARQYQQRQIQMYEQVLSIGAADGTFTLAASTTDTARNLLALEDSHGFSVLIGALTAQEMLRLLYDAAVAATGVSPAALTA